MQLSNASLVSPAPVRWRPTTAPTSLASRTPLHMGDKPHASEGKNDSVCPKMSGMWPSLTLSCCRRPECVRPSISPSVGLSVCLSVRWSVSCTRIGQSAISDPHRMPKYKNTKKIRVCTMPQNLKSRPPRPCASHHPTQDTCSQAHTLRAHRQHVSIEPASLHHGTPPPCPVNCTRPNLLL